MGTLVHLKLQQFEKHLLAVSVVVFPHKISDLSLSFFFQ